MQIKLNIKKVVLFIIIFLIIIIISAMCLYVYMVGPVNNNKVSVDFEVKSGETYSSIASRLKENNFIKSEFFYKLYLKINEADYLEAGTYKLNQSMPISEIIEILGKGSDYNPNAIILTIPEGRHITDIANIVSILSGKTPESYLNVWDSEEFINQVIEKYWFVTEKVKNKNIRYALEGYFFPSTYELKDKDVTAEYIAYKLLDQMEKVLNKYKESIDKSELDIHKILTFASIVEYEAKKDEDRPLIASVFYNRLNANMKFQSCATVGYAIDEWKLTYSKNDLNTKSYYNTYYYSGLPVGPGNSPSEKSLKAVLNPSDTDFYYFLSDVCDDGFGELNKVYYSKTYDEHNIKKDKYLECRQ